MLTFQSQRARNTSKEHEVAATLGQAATLYLSLSISKEVKTTFHSTAARSAQRGPSRSCSVALTPAQAAVPYCRTGVGELQQPAAGSESARKRQAQGPHQPRKVLFPPLHELSGF